MKSNTLPKVLDVTLRDGGYLNNWHFDVAHVEKAISEGIKSGADIIEVGYLNNDSDMPLTASWTPKSLEKIQYIRETNQLAAMCRPIVADADHVIQDRQGLIDLVRIPIDLRNTSLANRMASICIKHKMPCSFNLTNISCFSDDQIFQAFCNLTDEVKIIYIADSRGALQPSRVKEIYAILQSVRECTWGYHAHNNIQLAEATTRAALEAGVQMIDGSLLGIGLGGRNLDLAHAVGLAAEKRPELLTFKCSPGLSEIDLGVCAPGEELELYRWTGIKNFKMEWAMMMLDCLGLDRAIELVQLAPDYPLFSPDEYKPFVDSKTWNALRW